MYLQATKISVFQQILRERQVEVGSRGTLYFTIYSVSRHILSTQLPVNEPTCKVAQNFHPEKEVSRAPSQDAETTAQITKPYLAAHNCPD